MVDRGAAENAASAITRLRQWNTQLYFVRRMGRVFDRGVGVPLA
jgi:hypothetical protein